jgi:hypothetical protein
VVLAADEIERLRAECEEQARLNGMGAERELALRSENERLQAVARGQFIEVFEGAIEPLRRATQT